MNLVLYFVRACSLAVIFSVLSWAIPAAAEGKDQPTPSSDGRASAEADHPKPAKHALEVMVLHATNSGSGIDKRIGKMPELEKPPFSSFDSYRLLAKRQLPLVKGKPSKLRLPNRRVLLTELLKELPKEFVLVSARIDQPNGKRFLPLLEVKAKKGQTFIVAGQSYKDGILVLVLTVR